MLRWLWLSVVLVVIDQITKAAANHYLVLHDPIPVFPLFNLTLAYNSGAAFSFLADAGGWQRWFFTVLAIVVSTVIVMWMKKLPSDDHWQAAGLACVLSGAVGNVIDRVHLGYVVDFLDFYVGDAHWPAFNIADSAITVGMVILLIFGFRKTEPTPSKK